MSGVSTREVQFCLNDGVTHRDGTARREHHFLPKAHVLVRRRWVPIDPGDSKFTGVRCGNCDGDGVLRTDMNKIGDIKFVTAESAGDGIRTGEFLAIDPDIGPVVYPAKCEPDTVAFFRRGDGKFPSIPPPQ